MSTSTPESRVWCGWCHTHDEPHTHAVTGYRGLVSSEAKREVIRIMLDNVFPTTWGRQVHYDTYQHLSNRLFFRPELVTDDLRLGDSDAK
jgi:hypothetical protein